MVKNLILLLCLCAGLLCASRVPAQSMAGFSPVTITAGTGSILTITGSGFGNAGASANFYIGFASSSTPGKIIGAYYPDYISWTDNQIVLRVRTDAGTGPVYLVVGGSIVSSLPGLTISYDIQDAIYGNAEYPVRLVNSNGAGGTTYQLYSAFDSNTPAKESFLRAFKTWPCATNVNWNTGAVTNVNVIADDGVNVIRMSNTDTELDAGILGQTFTFYNSSDLIRWEFTGTDLVFSSAYSWNFGPVATPGSQFDFEHVALHELGHAHGLGHSNDINDVMYYGTSNGQTTRALNTNDINAGNYMMSLSTSGAATHLYPPMVALPAGSCKLLLPVISSFSPTSAATGTTITIIGTNLTGVNSVSFGNTPAQSFSGISDTQITAVVGNGTSGNVNVTTPSGLASMPGFVYLATQTISFAPFAPVIYGNPDLIPAATSSNNSIPIIYSSSNLSVATILPNGKIHIVGAGTSVITASQAGNANYGTAIPVTQTLTVAPAPLKVTANNQTKIYGAQNPVFTVSYSGFVNGDSSAGLLSQPSVNSTALASSPVGSYPISASGALSPNYTFSYITGILSVGTATLTITANNRSRNYGELNPLLTATFSGFVNGDEVSSLSSPPVLTTTANAASPLGVYPIIVSGASSPNYTINYIAGTLTVGRPILTITADDQVKYQGDPNPTLTISYAGFVNGDSKSVLLTPAIATTTATTNSAAGTYPIDVSGATAVNYSIQFVSGKLVINPTPAPVITSISPGTGLTGNTIIVTGNYFLNASSVSFGGVSAASFQVLSPTRIQAVVGSGASGDVQVSTPAGKTTFAGFIYIFSLAQNNFTVSDNSVSCKGKNNGSIHITAQQSLPYTATVVVNGISASYPFTSTLNIDNLAPGTYSVCITVAGQTDFSQCYSIVNTEPKDLSVIPSIRYSTNSMTLSLSGGENYYISLNGILYTTTDNSIDLPLQYGNNTLSVTTDKPCQGSFEKDISLSNSMIPFPNPFQGTLSINLGTDILKNLTVRLYSVNGELVYTKQCGNLSGMLQLNLRDLANAVYILKLSTDDDEKIFKILKR